MLPGASESSGCQKLIDILHTFGLSQLQRENTRGDRLLDLYVTNRPALVKSVNTVPSISDHDSAIVVDSNILTVLNKKTPRKVLIFSKAQWNSMKTDVLNFSTSFLESYKTRSINQNWNDIKSCVESTMNANIPTKTISGKNPKPWLTSDIRRLSRRKHRLYKRAKRSGKPEHLIRSSRKSRTSVARKSRRPVLNILTDVSLVGWKTEIRNHSGHTSSRCGKKALVFHRSG